MIVEYNGSDFFGWQKQDGKRTVQGQLEEKIEKLTGHRVVVEGSGRTDRGVHALGQVAMVEIDLKMPLENLKNALNNLLDLDIRIKSVKLGRADFHPRFSAKKKTYMYVVNTGEPSAIRSKLETYYPYDVDIELMKKAGKLLVGKHNFKAFCSANTSVTNFEREIYDLQIKQRGKKIIFEITGNGFLYNMVRIIVGTLLQIQQVGEKNIVEALKVGDRAVLGKTMPPNGLYLKSVKYF